MGTIIVKVVRAEPEATRWQLFAMVKRGGGFNAGGAAGWEFFVLRLTGGGAPVIFSRGASPSTTSSDPYATGEGVTCNSCHGAAARESDAVLTPSLRPPAGP